MDITDVIDSLEEDSDQRKALGRRFMEKQKCTDCGGKIGRQFVRPLQAGQRLDDFVKRDPLCQDCWTLQTGVEPVKLDGKP